MNCDEFQMRWFEFADGTLTGKERAEAELHLANCDGCRQTSQRQEQFGQALASSMRKETEPLRLRADIRHHILETVAKKTAEETTAILGFWRRWGWQAAGAAFVVLVIAGLVVKGTFQTKPETIQRAAFSTTLTGENSKRQAITIQMEYARPMPIFYREGGMVVDTVVDQPVLASGILYRRGQTFEQ